MRDTDGYLFEGFGQLIPTYSTCSPLRASAGHGSVHYLSPARGAGGYSSELYGISGVQRSVPCVTLTSGGGNNATWSVFHGSCSMIPTFLGQSLVVPDLSWALALGELDRSRDVIT